MRYNRHTNLCEWQSNWKTRVSEDVMQLIDILQTF